MTSKHESKLCINYTIRLAACRQSSVLYCKDNDPYELFKECSILNRLLVV